MEENINKLNELLALAGRNEKSEELNDQIAASTIYTGAVDFFAIQSARFVEEILVKSSLEEGKPSPIEIHYDSWFCDNKVSTRRILKEIEKIMPFRNNKKPEDTDKINKLISNFLSATHSFLNNRNKIIHGIGNPNNSLEQLKQFCKISFSLYHEVRESHMLMLTELTPFRLTAEQKTKV